MKTLSALILLALGMSVGMTPAMAQNSAPSASETSKKTPAKKSEPVKKKETAKKTAASAAADDDDIEPDISASTTSEFKCDQNDKITIYRNVADDSHIALRWNKKLLRLKRVSTTTGANRFENKKNGWVWIDIPTKGMLLDSKKGQQLANECRNAERLAPKS